MAEKEYPFGIRRFPQSVHRKLVQSGLRDSPYHTEKKCESELCTWRKLPVVQMVTMQTMYHDYFCVPIDIEGFKMYLLVDPNGNVSIKEVRQKSVLQIIRDVFTFYTKYILLAFSVTDTVKVKGLLTNFISVADRLKIPATRMYRFFSESIEFYQKQSAKIDEKLHINELQKLHEISVALSPDYKKYWLAQESKLSSLSREIFGDFQTVSSYVHLLETYFYIQIKNSKSSEDERRKDALIHGAKLTKMVGTKVNQYKKSPLKVWSDLFYYTFQEGNKYIDEKGVYAGKDIVADLLVVSDGLKTVKDKLTDFMLFETAYAETTLFTINEDIQSGVAAFDYLYNKQLKPTFNVIEKIHREQQEAIAELEKRYIEENERKQRAFLMSTDPDKLGDDERTIQNNQFIKLMGNAVGGVDEGFKFKTVDIGDL